MLEDVLLTDSDGKRLRMLRFQPSTITQYMKKRARLVDETRRQDESPTSARSFRCLPKVWWTQSHFFLLILFYTPGIPVLVKLRTVVRARPALGSLRTTHLIFLITFKGVQNCEILIEGKKIFTVDEVARLSCRNHLMEVYPS